MADESLLRALLGDNEEDAKELNRTRLQEQIAIQERENAESKEQDATKDRKTAENIYLDTIKAFQETLLGEFEELQEIVSDGIEDFSEEQTILEDTVNGLVKTVEEIVVGTATKLQQLEAMFKENAKENRKAQGILMGRIVSLEKKVEELTNTASRVVANGGRRHQGKSTHREDGNNHQGEEKEVFVNAGPQSPKKEVAQHKNDGNHRMTESSSRRTSIPPRYVRELEPTREFLPDYDKLSPRTIWSMNKPLDTAQPMPPVNNIQPNPDPRTMRYEERERRKQENAQGKGKDKGEKRGAVDSANNDNNKDQQPAMKKRKLSSAQKGDGSSSSLPPLVSYKAQINSGKSEEDNEEEIKTEGQGKF